MHAQGERVITKNKMKKNKNSRLNHFDAADIAPDELALAPAAGQHLRLQHQVLRVEFPAYLGHLVRALGHAERRRRDAGALEQRVRLVLVDVQEPALLVLDRLDQRLRNFSASVLYPPEFHAVLCTEF